jgi:hypothetical protein
VALALKDLYDLYGLCAGRVAERLEWDARQIMAAPQEQHD